MEYVVHASMVTEDVAGNVNRGKEKGQKTCIALRVYYGQNVHSYPLFGGEGKCDALRNLMDSGKDED